jgi:hypothetical protein
MKVASNLVEHWVPTVASDYPGGKCRRVMNWNLSAFYEILIILLWTFPQWKYDPTGTIRKEDIDLIIRRLKFEFIALPQGIDISI